MTTRTNQNGSATDTRIAELERKLDELIFYHAELSLRFNNLAVAFSAMMAQQMQPQVQQAILGRLMAGEQ
jgi:hypothetical protein